MPDPQTQGSTTASSSPSLQEGLIQFLEAKSKGDESGNYRCNANRVITRWIDWLDQRDINHLEQAMTAVGEYSIELVAFADISRIVALAIEEDIPIYDASYVALAEAIDSVCWTADGTLIMALSSQTQDFVPYIREFDESSP